MSRARPPPPSPDGPGIEQQSLAQGSAAGEG